MAFCVFKLVVKDFQSCWNVFLFIGTYGPHVGLLLTILVTGDCQNVYSSLKLSQSFQKLGRLYILESQ
jgi:hypothetical protein